LAGKHHLANYELKPETIIDGSSRLMAYMYMLQFPSMVHSTVFHRIILHKFIRFAIQFHESKLTISYRTTNSVQNLSLKNNPSLSQTKNYIAKHSNNKKPTHKQHVLINHQITKIFILIGSRKIYMEKK
jgi:hypothetical protein